MIGLAISSITTSVSTGCDMLSRFLAKAGRFENFKVRIMLSVAAVLYLISRRRIQILVLISAVLESYCISDWNYLGHFSMKMTRNC